MDTPTSSNSSITFLTQGATIQEFNICGHNIVLGFPEASLYKEHNAAYFGETIGRSTNRISNAIICDLNGKSYKLGQNDGPNSLHGGHAGWGKKPFLGPKPIIRNGKNGVQYSYTSRDGEEGYPGTVECKVFYVTCVENNQVVLDIEYEVALMGTECEETIVGVTNHSYFTLDPNAPSIAGTSIQLGTSQVLEMDSKRIPTGKVIRHPSVTDTVFQFGTNSPSFDDCFVMEPTEPIPLDTRTRPLQLMVSLFNPSTNLHLEVLSTEPAFQLYTGEGIRVPKLKTSDGHEIAAKGPRAGLAIEPSRFVDAQRKEWRAQCLLKKGESWGARSRYRAWKD